MPDWNNNTNHYHLIGRRHRRTHLILPLSSDFPLADLPTGLTTLVDHLRAPADLPEWADWLAELGFLPGERVQVVRRGPIGGDPLVVRIGDSTFALHRAEAACVMVHPQPVADAPANDPE